MKASEEEQQSYTVLLQEEVKIKEDLSKVTIDIQEIEEDLVNVSTFCELNPWLKNSGNLKQK